MEFVIPLSKWISTPSGIPAVMHVCDLIFMTSDSTELHEEKRTSRLSHWSRLSCCLQRESEENQNSRSCYIKSVFYLHRVQSTVFKETPMAECLYSSGFFWGLLCLFSALHKPHFWPFCFLKDPDDDKHLNFPRTWIAKHSHKDMKVCYLKHDCGRGSIMWHGAAYVNICLAEGVYSPSYLKKQIISGWAPLPCGTCSSFTGIILSAGRGSGVGSDKKEGEESVHHVKFPLNAFNFKIF